MTNVMNIKPVYDKEEYVALAKDWLCKQKPSEESLKTLEYKIAQITQETGFEINTSEIIKEFSKEQEAKSLSKKTKEQKYEVIVYRPQYTRGLGATKTLYPEVDNVLTCDYTLFGDPNAFDWTYFFKYIQDQELAREYLQKQSHELSESLSGYMQEKCKSGIREIGFTIGNHIRDYSDKIKQKLELDFKNSLENLEPKPIEEFLLDGIIKEFSLENKRASPFNIDILFWKIADRVGTGHYHEEKTYLELTRDMRLADCLPIAFEKRSSYTPFKQKFIQIADIILSRSELKRLITKDSFTPLLEEVCNDVSKAKSDILTSEGLYWEAIEFAKLKERNDLLRESLLAYTCHRRELIEYNKEDLKINYNPVGLETFETLCQINDIEGSAEAYFLTQGKYGDTFYWWALNKRYEKNFGDEIKQAKELFSKRQRIIDLLSEEFKEQLFYTLVNKLYREKDKTEALARAEILSKEFGEEIPFKLISKSALDILNKSHKYGDVEKFLNLESNLVSRLSGNSKITDKLKKRIEDGIDSIVDKYPLEDGSYVLKEQIWAVREYVRFSKCIGLPYPNQPYERSLFLSIRKIFSDIETSLSNSDDWNYEKFDSKIEDVESALSKIEWISDVQEDEEEIKIAHLLEREGNRIIRDVKAKKRLKEMLAEKKEKLKNIFK